MSKREHGKSRLHYVVLAIMLLGFSAVAATTSSTDPGISEQRLLN